MAVQDNIAAGYLIDFEGPLGVSVMSKLSKWTTLQRLGFAGELSHLSRNFHGLADFRDELETYSSANPTALRTPWKAIEYMVPINPRATQLTYFDPTLGQVGREFLGLVGFGQVFAISPEQLKSPTMLSSALKSGSSPGLTAGSVGV